VSQRACVVVAVDVPALGHVEVKSEPLIPGFRLDAETTTARLRPPLLFTRLTSYGERVSADIMNPSTEHVRRVVLLYGWNVEGQRPS